MLAITDPRVAGILPAPVKRYFHPFRGDGRPALRHDAGRRGRAREDGVAAQFNKLERLFANTGIERRHVSEAPEWYLRTRQLEERVAGLLTVTRWTCWNARRVTPWPRRASPSATSTCWSSTPSPALPCRASMQELINRVGFRSDVERLPIFGFGCGGGVAGLSRAASLARATPGANVLFLTVDLCSLCLRIDDPSIEMFVSASRFGDGAVGVVLRGEPGGPAMASGSARIIATGEHLWPGTERIMGWDMKQDGFGVVLSPQLPSLMRDNLGDAVAAFLAKHGLGIEDFDGFLFHPGGSKVLDTARDVLGLARGRSQAFVERAAGLRQHVVGYRAVRARRGDAERGQGQASDDGVRSGLFGLFRHPRSLGLKSTRRAARASFSSPIL